LTVSAVFADGTLSIVADGADTIAVLAAVGGQVQVSDQNGAVTVVPAVDAADVDAADVLELLITGGNSANVIDLSDMAAAAFTSLTSIVVNAGDGADSVIGATDLSNTINGEGGNDTLTGGGRGDSIDGGAGDDLILSQPQAVSIVSAQTVAEGDSGNTNVVLMLSLVYPSESTATVSFATQSGTATADKDFMTASGQITFAPGETTQTITVPIIGDLEAEPSEAFDVVLSNPANIALGQASSTVMIADDDGLYGGFDIQINFTGGLTESQRTVFAAAEQLWERIIIGDLPDYDVPGVGVVDDLVIDASGTAIDGVSGTLGMAGPDVLRPVTFLPARGSMMFDTADLADMEASGELLDVILHEMGHVLGFGTIWTDLNLLVNPSSNGGTDPRFIGAHATQEYNTRFGLNETGVPVEADGGPGTADSHWRESIFDNELMTGYISNGGGENPLTRLTIAQFADLGYQVDYSPADPAVVAPIHSANSTVSVHGQPGGSTNSFPPGHLTQLPDNEGDTLLGSEGNDTILAGRGHDVVDGGDGNDSLSGGDGDDTLIGGAGDDVADGEAANDLLIGDDGNDTLTGAAGSDRLLGGSGTDLLSDSGDFDWTLSSLNLTGNGTDIFTGIESALLTGGAGNNRLIVTSFTGPVTLNGNSGNDKLIGGSNADVLEGGDGDDTLTGNAGNDTLAGGDTTDGDAGSDMVIEAGALTYTLTSDPAESHDRATLTGAGTDQLLGIELVELVTANTNSRIDASGFRGDTRMVGGNGRDTLIGGSGDDYVVGRSGNDSLTGNAGNDTLLGLAGNDTLSGDAGRDSITAGDGNDRVNGGADGDVLDGGTGNDTLSGDAGDDRISGQADKDSLTGGTGRDTIEGGTHNDTIAGGDDADLISGDAGDDSLDGGTGSDLLDGRAGNDTLRGDSGNDTCLGGAGNDRIISGDGNDTVYGQEGNDSINGGNGHDVLNGGGGKDILLGGAGHDWLLGGTDDDTLRGDSGEDIINGQAGRDRLIGNAPEDGVIVDPYDILSATFTFPASLLAALEAV
jgi:Ca2+-binding RTX toxin-like protein